MDGEGGTGVCDEVGDGSGWECAVSGDGCEDGLHFRGESHGGAEGGYVKGGPGVDSALCGVCELPADDAESLEDVCDVVHSACPVFDCGFGDWLVLHGKELFCCGLEDDGSGWRGDDDLEKLACELGEHLELAGLLGVLGVSGEDDGVGADPVASVDFVLEADDEGAERVEPVKVVHPLAQPVHHRQRLQHVDHVVDPPSLHSQRLCRRHQVHLWRGGGCAQLHKA